MEIPDRGSRPSLALPEIYVHESNPEQFRSSSRSSSYNSVASPPSSSIPMSIPHSRDPVPPPLPPPKYLADIASGGNNGPDIAWRFGNSHGTGSDWAGSMPSVANGSSLYGSFASGKSLVDNRPNYTRRTSSTSTIKSSVGEERGDRPEHTYSKDEGYSSFSGTSIGSYRLVCRFRWTHNHHRLSLILLRVSVRYFNGHLNLFFHNTFNLHMKLFFAVDSFSKHINAFADHFHRSKYPDSSPAKSGFQSSVHDRFQTNAQAYDKSLLQKLDARRGPDNKTPPRGFAKSAFSSCASDASPTSRIALEHRQPNQLKPLSLPILTSRPGFVESPVAIPRYGDTPLSSGVSPGSSYPRFGLQSQFDYRSPSDGAESDRSPHPFIRRSGSSSVINGGDEATNATSRSKESFNPSISPDRDVDFPMEETGLRRLYIDEYSPRPDAYSPGATAGQKRRASSPPVEDCPTLHTVGSVSDLFRRRESGSRGSPTPRFHSASGSVSSTTSGPRNNSYASSTLSIAASSMTSMSSYGRLSPGGISPGGSDIPDSPYVASMCLNPSPRASVHHQRQTSETRPLVTSRKPSDGVGQGKATNTPKIQGIYMCECCPKKPKKFDSQEELKYI